MNDQGLDVSFQQPAALVKFDDGTVAFRIGVNSAGPGLASITIRGDSSQEVVIDGSVPVDSPVLLSSFAAAVHQDDAVVSSGSLFDGGDSDHVGLMFALGLTLETADIWGPAVEETEGYLGVKINRRGNTHFGWIRISSIPNDFTIIVHDWAFESIPGTPIVVGKIPEPCTVSLLGMVFLSLVAGIGRNWAPYRRETGMSS